MKDLKHQEARDAEARDAEARDEAVGVACARWARVFGSGSIVELRVAFVKALVESDGAEADANAEQRAETLRARVEAAHRATYGAKKLNAEIADERARNAAAVDDHALVAYEAKWTRRLTRLLHAHPERWRLSGLSDEELVSELTLRLIDAVRTMKADSEELRSYHRAGREWALTFLARQRQEIRKGFKLKVVVVADVMPTGDHDHDFGLGRRLNEEEAFLAREEEALFAIAKQRAEETLSQPQRRWLAAMKMTANAGAFFESSGKLNLASAARLLDKDRSSAQRAFGELHEHFTRERHKLGE